MDDKKGSSRKAAVDKRTDRSKRIFLKEFSNSKGNISVAAKAANITRRMYYHWQKNDKNFAQEAEEILEAGGDYVESKLMMAIMNNNIAGIIFYCKTRLKNRGYYEKTEIVGKNGESLDTAHKTTVVVTKDLIKNAIKELDEKY